MKTVIVLPDISTRGGVEQMTLNLADLFKIEFDSEVTILSCCSRNGAPAYEIPPQIKHECLELPVYPANPVKRIAWYLALKTPVESWLALNGADVLIAQGGYLSGAMARINRGGLIRIGCEHISPQSVNALYKVLRKWLYPKLDAFVVYTETYRKQYPWLKNIHCIPNFLTSFPARKATLESKTVVSIGRFTPQKGYDLLLPAWAVIHSAHPDWTLAIYGDGEERRKLEDLRSRLQLETSVRFMGGTNDVEQSLAGASLYVMPSRYEGFPVVLLQAMAIGLPCVSFDCGGPEALIEPGVSGILVPPGDNDAFAAAVNALLDDPAERARLAAAAVERAEEFSMEKVGKRWKTLLHSVKT